MRALVQKILLVGDDLPLMATRVAALRRTGADVVPCKPGELVTLVGDEKFDVVVLCAALEEGVQRSVVANAQRRWPQARILQDFTRVGAKPSVEPCAIIATMAVCGKPVEHTAAMPVDGLDGRQAV
jgi:CheY-like chemotaxis protein